MTNEAYRQTPRWTEGIDLDKLGAARAEAICRRFVGTCVKAGVPADLDFAGVHDWLTQQDRTLGIIVALESAWLGVSRVAGASVLAELHKDAPTVQLAWELVSFGDPEMRKDEPTIQRVRPHDVQIHTPARARRKARRGSLSDIKKVLVGGGALPFVK